MSNRSGSVTVGVSRQILWIGGDAYPIQNIARAKTIKVVPNRRSAWRKFAVAIVVWIGLGVAASLGLDRGSRAVKSADVRDTMGTAHSYVAVAVGVLVALSVIWLVVALSRRSYYILVIETAGTPHTVLASTDPQRLDNLVKLIMAAIDDPRISYQTSINTIDLRGAQGVQMGNYNRQDSHWQ